MYRVGREAARSCGRARFGDMSPDETPLRHRSSRVVLPSPIEPLAVAWRNRALVTRLARREIESRYRGSLLGLTWSVATPLLMLAVYTFVFSVVFKARWGTGSERKGEFALILFSGLITFGLFSECTNRAPGMILESISYVKKVVFPLETLAWVGKGEPVPRIELNSTEVS